MANPWAPADHGVEATYKTPTPFTYIYDGKTVNPPTDHHAFHKQTMSWMSNSGDITVTFPPGAGDPTGGAPSPQAPKGKWTKPVKLVGHKGDKPGQPYKYSVTINGKTDNPQIIFDDTGLPTTEEQGIFTGVGDLETIANSAKTAWEGLFAQLQNTAALPKHDPQALFFPFGINSINVTVAVTPVTITINVSGPGSAGGTSDQT